MYRMASQTIDIGTFYRHMCTIETGKVCRKTKSRQTAKKRKKKLEMKE